MQRNTNVVILVAALAWSCSSQPRTASPDPVTGKIEGASPLDYVLTDLEVFDLGIPGDFFQREGRLLTQYPQVDSCHMQGGIIDDEFLVLSCILFNREESKSRTYIGKGFILKARLCDLIGCSGAASPQWTAEEITWPIPLDHNRRISKMLFKTDVLSEAQRAIVHVMNHPSGLLYDTEQGGFWVGNAAYARDTYSRVALLRVADIGSGAALSRAKRTIEVPGYHTSALAVVQGRYMISPVWASRAFRVIDLQGDGQQITIPSPLADTDDHVQLQDCTRWQGPYIVCNGNREYVVDPAAPEVPLYGDKAKALGRKAVRMRHGRVQVLRFDVSEFPNNVTVELLGYMSAILPGRDKPSINLGDRKYRYDENGEKEPLIHNDYNGYILPITLTHEAMAVDPNREHIYFVPNDIPEGKLIRMRIRSPSSPH